MAAAAGKDTVYVDVDDEITNVIDKVKTSPNKIVALVLPKRASVLQSVVNMKLLKRAAAANKKSIVLITSEAGLMPLAGVAGLHVAPSLQSKPVIPPLPESPLDDETEVIMDDEKPLNKTASVGTLAAAAAVASKAGDDADDSEVIELDNVYPEEGPGVIESTKAFKKKHLRVPNFDKFRLSILIGVGVFILLIVGWIFAGIIMPKATITISTNTSTVEAAVDFTASTTQKTLDVDGKKVTATYKELKKTDTQKITATGTKDNGTKATGTMTVYNCSDDDLTLAAGTLFSNGGFSYATDTSVAVPGSNFTSGGVCKKDGTASVGVTATKAGDASNLSGGRDYTSNVSNVSGKGSAMAGGTSAIVKVVSQTDLDNAKNTMNGRLDTSAYTALKAQFEKDSLLPLEVTKIGTNQTVTSVPAVGAEATGEVTVTLETTYSMLGVKKDDLSKLVKKDASSEIDTKKQAITNDGLKEATFTIGVLAPDNKSATVNVQSSVTAGPEIDKDSIKNLAKGKKKGEIEKQISELPGVTDVEVKYSPFWVLSTPKAAKKITVVVKKSTPEQAAKASTGL